mgnify:CR=1 FL=1
MRKTVIDYHAAAFPGDVLRFHQTLTHHGRTSFTMRQTARRIKDLNWRLDGAGVRDQFTSLWVVPARGGRQTDAQMRA